LLVGADMEPLLYNVSQEVYGLKCSPFACRFLTGVALHFLRATLVFHFLGNMSMDGALRNEEQGNKGLAAATFSEERKGKSFIPNPCRFWREFERTRIWFFHFDDSVRAGVPFAF